MDESAYRSARDAGALLPCVFAKALASGSADCTQALRRSLAERETIGCASPPAQGNCALFAALARERAAFALKLAPAAALTHAAAMRLQCGGLQGLRDCVSPDAADVHRCIAAAQAKFGSLTELPWPGIVAAIARWRGRTARSRRPR